MAYVLFPFLQFSDNSGVPLASGKIYTYVGGTTTPTSSYSNSTGTVAANPVVLDSGGRPNSGTGMWLDSSVSYKFVIKDSSDVTIQTIDNYAPAGADITNLATNVSFVTIGSSNLVAAERVLTAGSGISITDAGAGSTATVKVDVNNATQDTAPSAANDYILTYDASAAATKKVVLQSVMNVFPILSGKFYSAGLPGIGNQAAFTIAGVTTTSQVNYVPILLPTTTTLTGLTCEVTVSQASTNLRLGLYASGSDLKPTGAPLLDSGNISCASTGVKTYSTSQVLTAGTLYYLAFNTDASTAQFTRAAPTVQIPVHTAIPTSTTYSVLGFFQSSAFGALPTVGSLTNNWGGSTPPAVGILT